MKTLSVTIICKDEAHNLARLLPTLTFANQVVVVDTGSADNSVDIAKRFTKDVYFYKWRDDFAKARNYAISRAASDYIMWLDCDDHLPQETIAVIEQWLNDDKQQQDFVYLKYRMGLTSQFWFWRERIIRRSAECRFKGFIHEAISPFGTTHYLDCEVIHTSTADHSARNLTIYRNAQTKGRRFALRDKYYYARTLIENGLDVQAMPILIAVASNRKAYVVDRVNCYKLLARTCMQFAQYDVARKYLSSSAKLLPPDPETCCLFGDAYYFTGNYLYAAQWYNFALHSNAAVGFVNDYYKRLYPYIQLSVCWWRQGDIRQAKFYHKLAKTCDPTNPIVLNNDRWF